MIKLDTEGYEYFIYKGGKEFFKKYKPLYIITEFETFFMGNRLAYKRIVESRFTG